MLINGAEGSLISIRDRGLLYGDGVFRTLLAKSSRALSWPAHYQKLLHDCTALGIVCPDFSRLSDELEGLLRQHSDAVLKIIVTRGESARGYAPVADAKSVHIWDVLPVPVYPSEHETLGIALQLCTLKLARQPRLAGIKHLNRLENVLAAAECASSPEGLLLDEAGLVIEGVRSNVFMVMANRLITPDLSRCGVAGVQRDAVIARARDAGMVVEVRDVALDEIESADEVFLTNSVFGLWPVARFKARVWSNFSRAAEFRAAIRE